MYKIIIIIILNNREGGGAEGCNCSSYVLGHIMYNRCCVLIAIPFHTEVFFLIEIFPDCRTQPHGVRLLQYGGLLRIPQHSTIVKIISKIMMTATASAARPMR